MKQRFATSCCIARDKPKKPAPEQYHESQITKLQRLQAFPAIVRTVGCWFSREAAAKRELEYRRTSSSRFDHSYRANRSERTICKNRANHRRIHGSLVCL